MDQPALLIPLTFWMDEFYVVMSRYYGELSDEERSFLIERLQEGWAEERMKAFLGMTYSEMKKSL